jgi:hypothetical protein
MDDHSSHQDPAHQPPDPLAPLRGQFPGWEAWRGVGGLLYARRRRSTPPVVFRDVSGEGLARQIREWEGNRGG